MREAATDSGAGIISQFDPTRGQETCNSPRHEESSEAAGSRGNSTPLTIEMHPVAGCCAILE